MDKRVKTLLFAIAIALLIAIASTSYAFFTIANKEGEETVIKSGTMGLHLEDGSKIELENAVPGASVTKNFYVENTGNVDTAYDLYLSEVINTFVDKTDLVYTLTSNDGGYSTTGQVQAPNAPAKIVDAEPIEVGGIHHYTLVVTFLEKNEAQDDNQGVEFSAKVQINEYKEANSENTSGKCYYVDSTFGDPSDIKSIGTKYLCDPGGGILRYFYVLSEDNENNNMNLLMERNLTEDSAAPMTWMDAIAYFDTGAGAATKAAWTGVLDVELPWGKDINDAAGGNPNWNYLDYRTGYKLDANADASHLSAYRWIFNYTKGCTEYGCDSTTDITDGTTTGYWLREEYTNKSGAWNINNYGYLGFTTCTLCENTYGIRPVITIPKANLLEEQIDSNSNNNNNNNNNENPESAPVEVKNGTLTSKGSEVCLGSECFYVVGVDSNDNIRLITKYPLNVGNCQDRDMLTNEVINDGIQDPNIINNIKSSTDCRIGGIAFASNSYWKNDNSVVSPYDERVYEYDDEGNTKQYIDIYTNAKNNGNYVASIAEYVDNYVAYISNQGYNVTGDLLLYSDFMGPSSYSPGKQTSQCWNDFRGCSYIPNYFGAFKNQYTSNKDSSFWIGSTFMYSSGPSSSVMAYGNSNNLSTYDPDYDGLPTLRPVIVLTQ